MQMLLWSRGYSDTQAVVVKATSAAARIAPRLLLLAPQSRAIYLHLAAEPYLATLLAGQNSSIDLRGMGKERFQRLNRLASKESAQQLHSLSLGELAAMTWSAEMLTHQCMHQSAPTRTLSLDFEAVLANPSPALTAVFTHLRLQPPPGYLESIKEAPVWGRYSKATEAPYSPQVRAEILEEFAHSVTARKSARAWHGSSAWRSAPRELRLPSARCHRPDHRLVKFWRTTSSRMRLAQCMFRSFKRADFAQFVNDIAIGFFGDKLSMNVIPTSRSPERTGATSCKVVEGYTTAAPAANLIGMDRAPKCRTNSPPS